MECSFFLFIFIFISSLFETQSKSISNEKLNDVPEADTKTLLHVHVIWRHGERNPWNIMPSDSSNGIESWPGGLSYYGQRGIQQNFHLGELIRKRYQDFLSDEFKVEEIYVRSSDKDRTLMAAQSTLAGIFPSDKLNPIPVHTIPYEQDRILNDRIKCPKAEQEEQLTYKGDKFTKYEKDNADLFKILGEKSGFGKIPLPFSEVWKVWEPLNGEILHPESHKIPDWVTPSLWNQIKRAYDDYSYGLFDSALFRRLRSGPLISSIFNQIDKKLENSTEIAKQKMYAISGHDSTIAGFLRAFEIRPDVFPLFATALIIELHRNKREEPFIRLFHRNDTTTDQIFELDIPKCDGNPCTLNKLKELAAPVIPKEWETECNIEGTTKSLNLTTLLCLFFAGLSILLLILLIATFHKYRKYKGLQMTSSSVDSKV